MAANRGRAGPADRFLLPARHEDKRGGLPGGDRRAGVGGPYACGQGADRVAATSSMYQPMKSSVPVKGRREHCPGGKQ